jgi:type I restriction enzyme, S subunit
LTIKKGYQLVKLSNLPQTKETLIPDDWLVKKIHEIGKIDPETIDKKYEYSEIEYVDIGSISDFKIKKTEKISLKERPSRAQKKIRYDDIILSTVRPYRNSFTRIDNKIKNLVCSTGFTVIRPDDSISSKLIFYNTKTHHFNTQMIRLMQGSNYPAVSSDDIENVMIPFPKYEKEREKIVSTISNMETQIELAEKKIYYIKKLKKGLIQKLFTKGINHKKFKKEPWLFKKDLTIPKEWDVKKIDDSVFEYLISGTNARSDLNETSEIRYIHYGDIHTKWDFVLDCDSEIIPRIDEEKVVGLPLLKDGDLIIADASEDVAGSGTSILLKNVKNKKIVAGLHTIVLRNKDENISSDFLKYMTSINSVKIQIISYVTGSKVFGLSKKNCKNIKVPFPKLPEQQKITSILSNMDEQIMNETKNLENLKKLNNSLMQKLLTGEIRIG